MTTKRKKPLAKSRRNVKQLEARIKYLERRAQVWRQRAIKYKSQLSARGL